MNVELSLLIQNKTRPFGLTLSVGGKDKVVLEVLKQEAKNKKGRVDIIETHKEGNSLERQKSKYTYTGSALYWSSSIINLEYDVVYIESTALVGDEKFTQLLHEYWPTVRIGGVLCGDLNTENKWHVENTLKDVVVNDNYWFKIK